MKHEDVAIPAGMAWSSPFAKWQGTLAEVPSIVGIKEASGSLDQASQIACLCNLTILSGDDSMTLPLMSIGGRGVVSSRLVSGEGFRLSRP